MAGSIKVGVNIGGLQEVQAAYRDLRASYVNRLVKAGAIKAGRRTVPEVKRRTKVGKRTGMLEKARGYRYRSYKRSDIWVVLVGARSNMHAEHSFWGKIVPTKYDHLFEGGRARVEAGVRTIRLQASRKTSFTGKPLLAIRVKHKNGRVGKRKAVGQERLILRNKVTGNLPNIMSGSKKWLSKYLGGAWTVREGKKVPGGYIVYAKSAKAVKGRKPVEGAEPFFARKAPQCVIDEIRTGLPRILAKYGNKVYR